jgi:hypothetical protein
MPTLNVAIFKNNTDANGQGYVYEYPEAFKTARDRTIRVNYVRALYGKTHDDQDQITGAFDRPLNNVCLYADFPQERDSAAWASSELRGLYYVGVVNTENASKKTFHLFPENLQRFHFAFATLDGAPIIPSSWVIDLTLKWEDREKQKKPKLEIEIEQ